jgi:AraC-like DNA-binding protein
MRKFTREVLQHIKDTYKPGTRVRLGWMNDPYTKLKPGEMGTVIAVDDIGTIHVNWDCGSTLGLVFCEDCCSVVKPFDPPTETFEDRIIRQILAIRETGETNMFDIHRVQQIAEASGYDELLLFTRDCKSQYSHFILTGEMLPWELDEDTYWPLDAEF